MPAFGGVHHINLSVTDLARSAEWYRRVMCLEPGWEIEDTDGRGQKTILLHPQSPFRLVLTLHRTNAGERFSEFATGLDHIAFTVSDRAELEGWQAWLGENGVECSEIKEGATGWLITFRDPDNIQLEMYTIAR